MKINLYYSLYFEKNEERRKELEKCFEMNLKAGFDAIYIFYEKQDSGYIMDLLLAVGLNSTQITAVLIPHRTTFQDFFDHADIRDADDLHICCNADIFLLPETLVTIKSIDWEKYHNLALCLSRWDAYTFTETGVPIIAHHLNRSDTADCWIYKGHNKVKDGQTTLGWPGSDNAIAHKMQAAGYKIYNPSLDIKTYHLHIVKSCNYRTAEGHVKGEMICPPPYEFHPPCSLNDIK